MILAEVLSSQPQSAAPKVRVPKESLETNRPAFPKYLDFISFSFHMDSIAEPDA
ncbi:MAG: hypothetical protein LLG93_16945 [Deltaproteobacteria bacterium]|nr:hypothetical protein [Deltaproteobacteria bacterium]